MENSSTKALNEKEGTNIVGKHGSSYTSISELISNQSLIQNSSFGSEGRPPLRNLLVEKAAKAYLRPQSFARESTYKYTCCWAKEISAILLKVPYVQVPNPLRVFCCAVHVAFLTLWRSFNAASNCRAITYPRSTN